MTTSGKIQVRYVIKETFNDFYILNLTGLARMGDFITLNDKDTRPGVWDCKANFLNRSEFTIQINRYDVKSKDSAQGSFITLSNPILLNPGEKYEFPPWELESINRPT